MPLRGRSLHIVNVFCSRNFAARCGGISGRRSTQYCRSNLAFVCFWRSSACSEHAQNEYCCSPRERTVAARGHGLTHRKAARRRSTRTIRADADRGHFTVQTMPGGSHPPLQHVPPPRMTNGSLPGHEAPVVVPSGAGGGGGSGAGGAVTVQTIPGGNHPPLQQIPPPRMMNGSLPAHDVPVVVLPGGGVVDGGGAGAGAVGVTAQNMPGGSHPPLQHVPPPRATNGSLVAQPIPLVVVPVGLGGGGAGAGAGAVTAHTIPGGNQLPLQHVPPPRATNGSLVAQPTPVVLVLTVGVDGGGAGAGAGAVTVQIIPGGSQPPSQHVPPPSATNGSLVAHAPVEVGGGGGGCHVPLTHVHPSPGDDVVHPVDGGGGGGVTPPASVDDETIWIAVSRRSSEYTTCH